MKAVIFSLLLLSTAAIAQVNAYFSSCIFSTPNQQLYLETYISVMGNTVSFKKNNEGQYQGQVEVGMLFLQGDKIAASKKYILTSQKLGDTLNRPNFIDVQRFSLGKGEYYFELSISDKNSNSKPFLLKRKITIDFNEAIVNLSDIELLASASKAENPTAISKNGYDLLPYMADFFYPENVNEIMFYAEIYNTSKALGDSARFLMAYYIESYESKKMLPQYTAFKKEKAGAVNVLLSKFNIGALKSGNYNLVIAVKNDKNELIAQKKVFFQRKNKMPDTVQLEDVAVENTFASKISNKDTLADDLKSLRPIAGDAEKEFIDRQVKNGDVKLMQQFLYNFWSSRSSLQPEQSWNSYHELVKFVNKQFNIFSFKGYETDRGRIYLQYGAPTRRDISPKEPNAYPYEVWKYDQLIDKSGLQPNQTNKSFVFYCREIATNNYELLHSDALGEIKDPQWKMHLHGRMVQSNDFENNNPPRHFGDDGGDPGSIKNTVRDE